MGNTLPSLPGGGGGEGIGNWPKAFRSVVGGERSLALLRTGVLFVFQSPGEVELDEPGGDQPSPSPWHLSADLQAPVPEQRVPWPSLRVPSCAQGRPSQASATRGRVRTPGATESHFHFPSQAMGSPPPALRGSLQGLKVAQRLAPLLSSGPAPPPRPHPPTDPAGQEVAGRETKGSSPLHGPVGLVLPGLWEP